MVHTLSFPSALTEEESHLKHMFEALRKLKNAQQKPKTESDSFAKSQPKRGLEDAQVATEQVKKLVKTGAMTINKTEEKHTFKRSKQLDKKLKEGDTLGVAAKFQPFSSSANDPSSSGMSNSQKYPPHLYDSFVDGRDFGPDSSKNGTTVYVRGYDLMEEPLKSSFDKFGKIVRIHVEDRRKSAFIEFETHEQADKAIKEMNGNMVNGITLRVTMARRQNYLPKFNGDKRGPWSGGFTDYNIGQNRFGKKNRFSDNFERRDRDMIAYDDANDF